MNGSVRDLVGRKENIVAFHAGIKELTEALGVSVRQLLDENAALFKEKINFKMPDGDGVKPHQDSRLVRTSMRVLSVR